MPKMFVVSRLGMNEAESLVSEHSEHGQPDYVCVTLSHPLEVELTFFEVSTILPCSLLL